MTIPSTALLDGFTRANENPLSGGGNWAKLSSSDSSDLQIVSNVVTSTGTTRAQRYWTPTPLLSDFEVYVTFAHAGASGGGLVARATDVGGADTWDGVAGTWGGSGTVTFFEVANGVFSTIGSVVGAFSDGDVLVLRGNGALLEVWKLPGGVGDPARLGSKTTAILRSGFVGISQPGGVDPSTYDGFGGGVPGSASFIPRHAGRGAGW